MLNCKWCGNPIVGNNNRYVYCSEECAAEAHRVQCRENFRRRYIIRHEEELERNRAYCRRKRERRLKEAQQ